MFWSKDESLEAETADSAVMQLSAESRRSEQDAQARAVETLAEILRLFGRHAFDLDDVTSEETCASFERWAQKLLVGEVPAHCDERAARKARGLVRDWGGARRFVERHRRSERDYVLTGMSNLRHAVRVFIQCTTGGMRAELASEQTVSEQLDTLARALSVNDHAQIRVAAERTASTVRAEMEQRSIRQAKQVAALQSSMQELKNELSQARRAAETDGLTQVFNRATFDQHITEVADQALLSGQSACVLMIDIDHFKGINDNFGHQSGDEVLRQIADAIVREFLRTDDFVARYGGEEFCVVCEATTFDKTRERAERLRRAVEKLRVKAFGKEIGVSLSFGIASLQPGETAQCWLGRADDALYRAKKKGRNRISIAPPSSHGLGGRSAPLGATLGTRPANNQSEPAPTRVSVERRQSSAQPDSIAALLGSSRSR